MRFNPEVHTVHEPGGACVNKISDVPASRAALEMNDRGFTPELPVLATNPKD